MKRTFLNDEQLDVIVEYLAQKRQADSSPQGDQMRAASRDQSEFFQNMGTHAVSMGLIKSFSSGISNDKFLMRQTIKAYFAATSVGIKKMCSHVGGSPRPLFLMCDPAIICCLKCVTHKLNEIQALGFSYDFECDVCGKPSEKLSAFASNIGPVMISGNRCLDCRDEEENYLAKTADVIVKVGPNKPCACGSGKKYKKCHGSRAA